MFRKGVKREEGPEVISRLGWAIDGPTNVFQWFWAEDCWSETLALLTVDIHPPE